MSADNTHTEGASWWVRNEAPDAVQIEFEGGVLITVGWQPECMHGSVVLVDPDEKTWVAEFHADNAAPWSRADWHRISIAPPPQEAP